jgi:hypothetical protein
MLAIVLLFWLLLPGTEAYLPKRKLLLDRMERNEEDSQSRSRKSAQGAKWSFCLTAGKIGARGLK